jgi:hypothetical protein
VLGQNLNNAIVTIELGANQGILSSQIAQRVREHWAIDIFTPKICWQSKGSVCKS